MVCRPDFCSNAADSVYNVYTEDGGICILAALSCARVCARRLRVHPTPLINMYGAPSSREDAAVFLTR